MDEKKELKLPTEDHVPMLNGLPKDMTMIILGPPKVGKTTLALSFPKSLLLECDPEGAKYIKCRKIKINGLGDLRDAWGAIKNDTQYETIVIDTLDRIAKWHEDEICSEMGLSSIMDAKKGERHGAQWSEYCNRILRFVEGWRALGKRLIFVAHTKKLEIGANNVIVTPKTINIYGQAAGHVLAVIENIGFMYAEETPEGVVRKLSFQPGAMVEAGARHPALKDKVLVIPEKNPYSALESLFVTVPTNGKEKVKGGK